MNDLTILPRPNSDFYDDQELLSAEEQAILQRAPVGKAITDLSAFV